MVAYNLGCRFLLTVRCPLSHFPSWKWSGLCGGEGRAPSGVVSRHRPWKEGAAQHAALGYRHAELQVSVDVSIHATKVGVVLGIWVNMEHVTHRNSRNLRLALGRVTGGFSEPMRMPCACWGGVVRLVGVWLAGPLLPWSLWPSGGPCRGRQRAEHMPIHSWGVSGGMEGRGRTLAGCCWQWTWQYQHLVSFPLPPLPPGVPGHRLTHHHHRQRD